MRSKLITERAGCGYSTIEVRDLGGEGNSEKKKFIFYLSLEQGANVSVEAYSPETEDDNVAFIKGSNDFEFSIEVTGSQEILAVESAFKNLVEVIKGL